MQLKIKTADFVEAITQLKKMAPKGRGRTAYLRGAMNVSQAQAMVIFSVGEAKQICEGEGVWAGKVWFPFENALGYAMVPPKTEHINLSYIDGKLKIANTTLKARIEY